MSHVRIHMYIHTHTHTYMNQRPEIRNGEFMACRTSASMDGNPSWQNIVAHACWNAVICLFYVYVCVCVYYLFCAIFLSRFLQFFVYIYCLFCAIFCLGFWFFLVLLQNNGKYTVAYACWNAVICLFCICFS